MLVFKMSIFVMAAAVCSGVLTLVALLVPFGLSGQQVAQAITVAHLVGIAAGYCSSCAICKRILKGYDGYRLQPTTSG